MNTYTPLYEKHRPKSLNEISGNTKAVEGLRRLLDRRGTFAGSAYWIAGPSGCGKTTLARIIAAQVAHSACTVEYRSGREVTADVAREIGESLGYYGFGEGGRAVIINESHHLGGAAIDLLLGIIEPVPRHAVVIFTTTKDGEDLFGESVDAGPFASRCIRVGVTSQGMAAAGAEYVYRVACEEHLDGGATLEDFIKLMKRADIKNNLRAALQMVDDGFFVK